jgi:hypothetical protein
MKLWLYKYTFYFIYVLNTSYSISYTYLKILYSMIRPQRTPKLLNRFYRNLVQGWIKSGKRTYAIICCEKSKGKHLYF